MPKKNTDKDVLSLEEALRMEIFINQAIMAILIEKGITTQDEIMQKITTLRTNSKLEIEKSSDSSK